MNRVAKSLSKRSARVSIPLLFGVLAAVVAVALLVPGIREPLFDTFGGPEKQDTGRFVVRPVAKAPFRIEISEEGRIDSVRSATLSSNVQGMTTIISIVPEGSVVGPPTVTKIAGVVEYLPSESESIQRLKVVSEEGEERVHDINMGSWTKILVKDRQMVQEGDYLAGDVVCELDSSSLVDSELAQQIKVTGARATLETAETNLKIQETTNDKLIAAAKLAEELAELDLEKYKAEGGEYDQARDTILGDIKQNEEELAIAQEEYNRTRDLARKSYANLFSLEAARVAVTQKKIILNVKQGELDVLERFTKRRTEAELEQMATDTKQDTKRVMLEAQAAMAKMRADLEASTLTLNVEEETLTRLQRQISECRLVAPQAGEVVYAKQESRRGDPVAIEEGAQVRERQEIIKLPDLSEMRVQTRIHESRIRQVAVGQDVEITPNSRPDLTFHGKIESVASLPVPGEWPNNSQMEFQSSVTITDGIEMTSQLKPGMQAEMRIIVEERDQSVLQVPVQAVVPVADRFFAFVKTPTGTERRTLSIGKSNDAFTEVIDGLASGEKVIMNPRTHFSNEINQLEQDLKKDEEEQQGQPDAERPQQDREKRKRNADGGRSGRRGAPGA